MAAQLTALGPEPMLHNGLIAAHALSGGIAFLLGALAHRRGRHPAQARAYALALTLMAVFVTGAVALDWQALSPAIQGLYTALLALAGYTVWRGWKGRSKLTAPCPALGNAVDDIDPGTGRLLTAAVAITARLARQRVQCPGTSRSGASSLRVRRR